MITNMELACHPPTEPGTVSCIYIYETFAKSRLLKQTAFTQGNEVMQCLTGQ